MLRRWYESGWAVVTRESGVLASDLAGDKQVSALCDKDSQVLVRRTADEGLPAFRGGGLGGGPGGRGRLRLGRGGV